MRLHYPDFTEVTIAPTPDKPGFFSLFYFERFLVKDSDKDKEFFKNTLQETTDMVRNILGPEYEITCGDNWVRLYHPALTRNKIGEHLSGEFLAWIRPDITYEQALDTIGRYLLELRDA